MIVSQRIKDLFISLLAVSSAAAFPILFLYFNNVSELSFAAVLLPLLIFIMGAVFLSGVCIYFFKSIAKGALLSLIMIIVFTNYTLIEMFVQHLFPILKYWHIVSILIFGLIHLSWFLWHRKNDERASIILHICAVIFCVLILVNLSFAIPALWGKLSILIADNNYPSSYSEQLESDTNYPNVYYLLFDEYSTVEVLKQYYNYDNRAFIEELERMGFYISKTSHNKSIMTTTVMTNILNLSYVVDDATEATIKDELRRNPPWYQIMERHGYSIQAVGDAEFMGLTSALGTSEESAKTLEGDTAFDLIMKQTALYPFYTASYSEYANVILQSLDFFENKKNFADFNTFTVMHLDCPHSPFMFGKNGERVKDSNYRNFRDKSNYLNQLIYITGRIEALLNKIVARDPKAIIILQSDHSIRYLEDITFKDQSHILNAVYYGGESLTDIEGLSGMDAIIYVTNRLLGEGLPMGGYKYEK